MVSTTGTRSPSLSIVPNHQRYRHVSAHFAVCVNEQLDWLPSNLQTSELDEFVISATEFNVDIDYPFTRPRMLYRLVRVTDLDLVLVGSLKLFVASSRVNSRNSVCGRSCTRGFAIFCHIRYSPISILIYRHQRGIVRIWHGWQMFSDRNIRSINEFPTWYGYAQISRNRLLDSKVISLVPQRASYRCLYEDVLKLIEPLLTARRFFDTDAVTQVLRETSRVTPSLRPPITTRSIMMLIRPSVDQNRTSGVSLGRHTVPETP
jgi:hypothetical protein